MTLEKNKKGKEKNYLMSTRKKISIGISAILLSCLILLSADVIKNEPKKRGKKAYKEVKFAIPEGGDANSDEEEGYMINVDQDTIALVSEIIKLNDLNIDISLLKSVKESELSLKTKNTIGKTISQLEELLFEETGMMRGPAYKSTRFFKPASHGSFQVQQSAILNLLENTNNLTDHDIQLLDKLCNFKMIDPKGSGEILPLYTILGFANINSMKNKILNESLPLHRGEGSYMIAQSLVILDYIQKGTQQRIDKINDDTYTGLIQEAVQDEEENNPVLHGYIKQDLDYDKIKKIEKDIKSAKSDYEKAKKKAKTKSQKKALEKMKQNIKNLEIKLANMNPQDIKTSYKDIDSLLSFYLMKGQEEVNFNNLYKFFDGDAYKNAHDAALWCMNPIKAQKACDKHILINLICLNESFDASTNASKIKLSNEETKNLGEDEVNIVMPVGSYGNLCKHNEEVLKRFGILKDINDHVERESHLKEYIKNMRIFFELNRDKSITTIDSNQTKFLRQNIMLSFEHFMVSLKLFRDYALSHGCTNIAEIDEIFKKWIDTNSSEDFEKLILLMTDKEEFRKFIPKGNFLGFVKYHLGKGLVATTIITVKTGLITPVNYKPSSRTSNEINTISRFITAFDNT